jgi:hypothetical protein
VRARAGWIACAGLALLLPLSRAGATQPIVEPQPPRLYAASGTSVEQFARAAEGSAFSSTNSGVLVGLGAMLAAIPAGSGGVLLAGYGVCVAGVVAGPVSGWARAGYPSRARMPWGSSPPRAPPVFRVWLWCSVFPERGAHPHPGR